MNEPERLMKCPNCGKSAVKLTHTQGLPELEYLETARCEKGHEWEAARKERVTAQ